MNSPPSTILAADRQIRQRYIAMAAAAGFEPANAGVKVPCLTSWLYRYMVERDGFEPPKRTDHTCTQVYNVGIYGPLLWPLAYALHFVGSFRRSEVYQPRCILSFLSLFSKVLLVKPRQPLIIFVGSYPGVSYRGQRISLLARRVGFEPTYSCL